MSQAKTQPLELAIKQFRARFETDPQYFFQAPGRINLIGEHTDYNQGFVLPCAINRGTFLCVKTNELKQFRVLACDIGNELSQWPIDSPVESDTEYYWANYLRGVHAQFLQRGFIFKQGLDITIAGNIPQGAGLSSSASVSVAFATALCGMNQWDLSPVQIAQLCQAAENYFVGCMCGIMDQLSSASGKEGKALLIDCADLTIRHIAMPSSLALMIIDSKVKRGLVESEYNTRRKQCEEAAQFLGVTSLRAANLDRLFAAQTIMPEVVFKRARHVITENNRTLAAADALDHGDIALLSRLMALCGMILPSPSPPSMH
jgi:galactokinase